MTDTRYQQSMNLDAIRLWIRLRTEDLNMDRETESNGGFEN